MTTWAWEHRVTCMKIATDVSHPDVVQQPSPPPGSGWELHSWKCIPTYGAILTAELISMWQRRKVGTRVAVRADDLAKVYVALFKLHNDAGGGPDHPAVELIRLMSDIRNEAEDVP